MLVERRLEVVGILAGDPPLLDPGLQLGDHGVEIDGVVRERTRESDPTAQRESSGGTCIATGPR